MLSASRDSMTSIARIAACFAIVMVAFSGVHAAPPPEREARELVNAPRGSTSLGRTSGGELLNPASLPKRGRGFALLSMVVSRKTHFGTSELIAVIERATSRVAERFPGSELGVGNLGFADGKKIPWSVSHQAGRDGDLGMYATMADGVPFERGKRGPLPFHVFDALLNAKAQGAVVRFDLPRNLALVQALVEDPEARVQYIFVAAWLKRALLEEGRRQGVGAQTLARLGEVMHQPTDSNPHADHYHVRLFCTIEDRLYGCVDRAPPRSWVEPGDREHAAMARKVASVLEMDDKRHEGLVLAALTRLGAMRATGEVEAIGRALADARKKVRVKALETLEAIGDSKVGDTIVSALPAVQDPAWAARLFAIVPRLTAPEEGADPLLALAKKVIEKPQALLHPKAARAEPEVLRASLEVLTYHGRSDDGSVELALGLLSHKDKKVRKAAEVALQHLLCQPLRGQALEEYWKKNRQQSPTDHAEVGLRRMKLLTVGRARSREAVGQLIGLLDRRQSEVRVCAQRLLTSLTGHDSDARLRGPVRNKRHWTNWWRDNQGELELR